MLSLVVRDADKNWGINRPNFNSEIKLILRIKDYGYHSTVPIPGETLSVGWLSRWYTRQLIILSFDVSLYHALVVDI